MTIWILALSLFAGLAGAGYRQGAIRVAFSLLGLIMASILAMPLGRVLFPLLGKIGLKNPVLAAFIAPIVVFVLVLLIFKTAGLFVHRKVDVYYKYHTGDLRTILWQRLNRRLGLCLGPLNAMIYLLLIGVIIYTMSYWTTQMQTEDKASFAIKTLNRAGKDLGSSGLLKAVRAIDPATENYYKAADMVGIIYQNPLIYARLYRYPGFLSLAERPELREITDNTDYTDMLQRHATLGEFIEHPKTRTVLNNPQLLKDIWITMTTDLDDLQHYLESPTGESPKYDPQTILGRWVLDVNTSVAALVKKLPANVSRAQLTQIRQGWSASLARGVFIAAPNGAAFFRAAPDLKPGALSNPAARTDTLQGSWKKIEDGKYELTFTKDNETQQHDAAITGEKLSLQMAGIGLVLLRED